jgi:hypothetical protein
MKKLYYNFIKAFGLAIFCSLATFPAMAQSQGYIEPAADPVEYSTCIPVSWGSTPTSVPYHLTGIVPYHNADHYTWSVRGDLQIDSISADTLTVYVSSHSTDSKRDKDFAKGRIYVSYREDTISNVCGNPSAYYDVYKIFKDTVTQIVGPDCINEGDTVTFSINAMVSQNINSMIGIDRYYWDWSEGLVDSLMYYSGDSSSITFIAGPLTGHDIIFVDMGQCNLDDGFRYTKILGQAIEDPIFATGFEPSTCMPFGVTRDTIIISNPQDNVTYDWDLGSWKEIYTSAIGDTIIFSPASNALEIELSATGPCETKDYEYMISRTLTSQNALNLATKCLVEDDDVVFSVTGVPDGTEMTWSVTGTGWVLDPADVHVTQPTITVGSDTGFVSVRTKDCPYTLVDTILIQPNMPGVFINPDTCLSFGVTSSETYTINKVANANSYEWELPSGWSGSSVDTFIVATPNGTNVGTVKVRAVGCSNSDWRTLNIAFSGIAPDSIINVNPSCISSGMADTVTLAVYTPISAQEYSWIIPSTWTIINSTSNNSQVILETDGVDSTYTIGCYVSNNCGITDTTEINLTISGMDLDDVTQQGNSRCWYYHLEPDGWDPDDCVITWVLDGNTITYDSYTLETDCTDADLIGSPSHTFYVTVNDTVNDCTTRRVLSGTAFRSAKVSSIVETVNIEQSMSVYPNPTNSILNVVLTSDRPATISLIDISGKIIEQIETNSNRTRFDVSALSSGFYIVSVNQNGTKMSKRVIIKK